MSKVDIKAEELKFEVGMIFLTEGGIISVEAVYPDRGTSKEIKQWARCVTPKGSIIKINNCFLTNKTIKANLIWHPKYKNNFNYIPVNHFSYDDLFMNMAYLVAMKSKDQSTHIGAVVVGPDNEVRSTGLNSFPRGINDNLPERQERPEKYFFFAHGERNAVYNAARMGTSLKDCRIYTNGVPCSDCAIAIIQSGISEVIVDKDWDKNNKEKWSESAKRSLQMFEEAGITVRYWLGDLVQINRFRSGEEF